MDCACDDGGWQTDSAKWLLSVPLNSLVKQEEAKAAADV